MKQKKFFFLLILFTTLYVYITNFDKIPDEIVLFQDENYELNYIKGIEIEGDNISVAESIFNKLAKIKSDFVGNNKLTISVFGGVMKKDVNVSVLPTTSVMLGGDTIGIRLYSKGVLVIGESPIQGVDGNWYEPYSESSIEKGDKIMKINNTPVETITELVEAVNSVQDNQIVTVEYEKDGSLFEENMVPVKSFEDGVKRLGLWVRDGAMGVGTLTFYDPDTKTYGALGHGISDYDLKELIDVDVGSLNIASILNVTKGAKNEPGEIKGLLNEEFEIGNIEKNNENGIYGSFIDKNNYFRGREKVLVASKNEVKTGKATVICTVDKENVPKEYEIEILKVNETPNVSSKGMIIKVTDEELLKKTGGIIQGMSGSPILQNGKLVGAVTHVYVNDPTKGYAIYAENMIKEASECQNKLVMNYN